MAHVMYLINNVVQIAIILFFMNNILKSRINSVLLELIVFVPFTIVYLIGTFVFEWPLGNVLFNVLRNIPNILGLLIGFEGKFIDKVKSYIQFFCIMSISSIIGMPILLDMFGVEYNEVHYANSMQNIGMMVWSDIALAIILLAIAHKNRKDDFFRKNKRNLAAMIGFPIMHLIFMYLYFRDIEILLDYKTVFIHLMYQTMVIILIIAQYYALRKSHALLKAEENLRHLQVEIQHNYDYCMLAEEKFNDISKLRHDINNQIQDIKRLIAVERNGTEASRIIDELQQKLMKMRSAKYCANPVINAVLAPKAYAAEENGIASDITLHDSDELPFDNYDICSLFANLYDNAAEACMKLEGSESRFIELRSRIKGRYYMVKIVNSCVGGFSLEENELPHTTKDASGHGYGMQIIQSIAKKYDGDMQISCENNRFTVIAALKLPEEVCS